LFKLMNNICTSIFSDAFRMFMQETDEKFKQMTDFSCFISIRFTLAFRIEHKGYLVENFHT
jgi:hypothetical protein